MAEGAELQGLRSMLRDRGVWTGVLFAVAGATLMLLSFQHPVGTAAQMETGYFPAVIGALLIATGAVRVLVSVVSPDGPVGPIEWRPIVFVIGSLVFFGLFVRTLGLALTTACIVGLASLAGKERRAGELAALMLVMMAIACLGFAYALGIALPLWPAF